MLVCPEGMERLRSAHVLVVGLGGVGGYAAEMLARAGVGHLTIVDGDVVCVTNINRQLVALHSTIGGSKSQLFGERIRDINPECKLTVVDEYIRDDRMVELLQSQPYDYVVDAIDTLSPKVFLLYHCHRLGLSVVSSMGSAGKLDPSQVCVSDLSQSHTCPLAAMVRKRLHRMGVTDGIQVVFSTEKVAQHAMVEEIGQNKRTTIGTISYLPPLFGCFCASVVINQLIQSEKNE
jgi:tRNA A37 threonylcarbamoyladenosine dehydratase